MRVPNSSAGPFADAVDRVAGVQPRVPAGALHVHAPGLPHHQVGAQELPALGPMQGFSAGGCGSCDGRASAVPASPAAQHSAIRRAARTATVVATTVPGMRVLSIDGGGIRGLIPAIVLTEIERRAGRRVCEMFDLIAGTSTGGILACALCAPDPLPAVRGGEAVRGRGPRHLQPLALPAHPERRRPARREVRRRRARARARAVPRREAAVPDEARHHRPVLRHGRARPVLLQDHGREGVAGRRLPAVRGGPRHLRGAHLLRAGRLGRARARGRRRVRRQPGDVRPRRGAEHGLAEGRGARLARHRRADAQAELRRDQGLGPRATGRGRSSTWSSTASPTRSTTS